MGYYLCHNCFAVLKKKRQKEEAKLKWPLVKTELFIRVFLFGLIYPI